MEKNRAYIDAILSKIGLDYRDIGNTRWGDIIGEWARKNPSDPLSQQINANPQGFHEALVRGIQKLKDPNSGGLLSEAEIERRLGVGTTAQSGTDGGTASDIRIDGEAYNPATQTTGPDPAQAESDAISKTINDIVQRLSQPVIDPVTGQATDRIYDTLLKGGATAGMTSATMRGVGGPLAGANAVESANSAALPYLQQRESLLQSALGLQNNRSLGLEDRRQGAAGLNLQQQQFNNGVATNQWAADQNNQQGILGAIGGVGGAIVGGIAGGPQGAVAGAKTGAGLLAGVGSAAAPPPAVKSVEPYQMFKKNKGVR